MRTDERTPFKSPIETGVPNREENSSNSDPLFSRKSICFNEKRQERANILALARTLLFLLTDRASFPGRKDSPVQDKHYWDRVELIISLISPFDTDAFS